MVWAKFDDQYPLHPKILRVGLDALGFDVAGIAFCCRTLSDGFIADELLTAVYPPTKNPRKIAARLVEVDRWERDEVRGGYVIKDFLDYNPSKDEVEGLKRKRSEAGRKGGARSRGKASASTNGQAESNPVPVPVPEPGGDGSTSQTAATVALIERIAELCETPDAAEAKRVVTRLLEHVDIRLLDECVGWAEQRPASKRPRSPRFFGAVVRDWAKQRGVAVPGLSS